MRHTYDNAKLLVLRHARLQILWNKVADIVEYERIAFAAPKARIYQE